MDAFFAAIEEREHPRLAGRPIVVGADPEEGEGRGVVATANYAARVYGIHSAMPISTAWRLAEEGRRKGGAAVVFMEGDFSKYTEASRRIMSLIRQFSPRIEEASIDEAYFDLSPAGTFRKARGLAGEIKNKIRRSERLTASIGIGPNKMIAKIASDMEKPDGLTVIGDDDEGTSSAIIRERLAPLPVRKIPGIGPKTEKELARLSIRTIGDLQRADVARLEEYFGEWGNEMRKKASGAGSTELIEEWEAKSVGEQETFMKDTLDMNILSAALRALAEDVGRRLKQDNFKTFRAIVLTVRFGDFSTKTRSRTLASPVSDPKIIEFEGFRLLMPFLDGRENPERKLIRLLGLRVEKLL